jgi:hypothetical protein
MRNCLFYWENRQPAPGSGSMAARLGVPLAATCKAAPLATHLAGASGGYGPGGGGDSSLGYERGGVGGAGGYGTGGVGGAGGVGYSYQQGPGYQPPGQSGGQQTRGGIPPPFPTRLPGFRAGATPPTSGRGGGSDKAAPQPLCEVRQAPGVPDELGKAASKGVGLDLGPDPGPDSDARLASNFVAIQRDAESVEQEVASYISTYQEETARQRA